MYEKLVEEIIAGKRLKRSDDLQFLIEGDLESLCKGADQIREALCGKHVDLCSIINGKAGRCGEDCKFCAQSGKHHTGAKEYGYTIYGLDMIKEIYEKSCPLRFIENWKLDGTCYAKQYESANIDFLKEV